MNGHKSSQTGHGRYLSFLVASSKWLPIDLPHVVINKRKACRAVVGPDSGFPRALESMCHCSNLNCVNRDDLCSKGDHCTHIPCENNFLFSHLRLIGWKNEQAAEHDPCHINALSVIGPLAAACRSPHTNFHHRADHVLWYEIAYRVNDKEDAPP